MQSEAANVAQYIAEAPEERRAALKKMRALCRKVLAGYHEGVEYGMPVYRRGEKVVAFASQVQYLAVYGLGAKNLERHKAELQGASLGKGCVRFRRPAEMDFGLMERMLREAVADSKPG